MATILIVEDEFDIRELLEAYLTNEGYKVIAAEDEEEALERFHDGHPDLVLLDLLLPGLDGFQVCRAIREESDLPVIMLTALGSEQSELKGFGWTTISPSPFRCRCCSGGWRRSSAGR